MVLRGERRGSVVAYGLQGGNCQSNVTEGDHINTAVLNGELGRFNRDTTKIL